MTEPLESRQVTGTGDGEAGINLTGDYGQDFDDESNGDPATAMTDLKARKAVLIGEFTKIRRRALVLIASENSKIETIDVVVRQLNKAYDVALSACGELFSDAGDKQQRAKVVNEMEILESQLSKALDRLMDARGAEIQQDSARDREYNSEMHLLRSSLGTADLTEDTLEQEQQAAGDREYDFTNCGERFAYTALEATAVSVVVNPPRSAPVSGQGYLVPPATAADYPAQSSASKTSSVSTSATGSRST